ncbi:hypothetical protein PPERSA_01366 [Pseudocohnilembus persalinus]|uniref:DIX domain-containing protein n=1 Tax=Pseudocohnilembus persalinus TaxID=266149 RepID=A0A0V0QGZ6_PSEPJ|nr:hypothetical protein PPERSA_01366 [Pseudocohnilembus persalinus]|eukprot:KRX01463.1 hypothetical protein PPERSA_01366 [Pseudocohnilembus persalinus]
MSSNFTMVYYHVPADGDDQHTPNAFGVSKDIEQIRVNDLRKNFPLEGEYIFRFKFKNDGKVLWLDIPEQAKSIPRYNDCIYIKAVKIPEPVKQQDISQQELIVGNFKQNLGKKREY